MVTSLLETGNRVSAENSAFRPEYTPKVNPNALRKDIESYLGEYRFQVREYKYELLFGLSDGEGRLLDIDDNVPLITKAARAIKRREEEGKSIFREEAELQGLKTLENQIQNSNIGDEIIWISPPGAKSDGYGNYGFIYLGKVDQVDDSGSEKHLSMSAIRVENPTLQQFNSAMTILTGRDVAFGNVEDFLASPIAVSKFWERPDSVLSYIFNLQPDNNNDSLFKKIIPFLSPYIQEFINYVKQGVPKDILFQAFQTIELLALDLIKEYSNRDSPQIYFIDGNAPLAFAMTHYQGQKPPLVAGSCGSTGSSSDGLTSPSIFNKHSSLAELFSTTQDDKEPFVCPKCGFETKESVGDQCPSCRITKEEAVEQGLVTC